MSLTWGSMQVTEDEHGDIHAVAIPEMCEAMVEAGEAHEAEARRIDACLNSAFLIASAIYAAGAVAAGWLAVHFVPWGVIWENLVWIWNAGPDYLHFLRWAFLGSIGMMLFFCGVGLVEWWRKGRR